MFFVTRATGLSRVARETGSGVWWAWGASESLIGDFLRNMFYDVCGGCLALTLPPSEGLLLLQNKKLQKNISRPAATENELLDISSLISSEVIPSIPTCSGDLPRQG